MLSEEFVSSVCGPPLSSNTALAKDVGIYTHTLSPVFGLKSTFKKSSTPANCLAVNDTHVFAAQHEKAYVHVYSRVRGSQEAFIPFAERIHSLALAGDVLVLGTAEGRLLLWEVCTGRLVSAPSRHVQAVCALATTRLHVLSGSEDSNIHVWSLVSLLELGSVAEHEPVRSLTAHRAAVTSVAVSGGSSNPHTGICVSASRDKTCIIWNYHSGESLRTILFPSAPLCVAIDPAGRALHVSSEDGSLSLVELFADRALIGPHSVEDPSTVVQVGSAFGNAPSEAGPALCLSLSYDGTALLTGHANGQIMRWSVAENETQVELANLNAAVTNIVPISPLSLPRPTKSLTVVRPTQAERNYRFLAQFDGDLQQGDRHFDALVNEEGFPQDTFMRAIAAFQQPAAEKPVDLDLQKQNEELWAIVNEQRALQMETLERLALAKGARPRTGSEAAAGRDAAPADELAR